MLNRLKHLRMRAHRRDDAARLCRVEPLSPAESIARNRRWGKSPAEALHDSLLSAGRRLHTRFANQGDQAALAVLDASGVVISWHDGLFAKEAGARAVAGRHVSQFYVHGDIALGFLSRSLRAAADAGRDTREGWRRRTSGAVFWGSTVIEPITDADGQLFGFTHVTRRSNGPWQLLLNAVGPKPGYVRQSRVASTWGLSVACEMAL